MAEFLEVGGVLTVLEILGLKQAKEVDVSFLPCNSILNMINNLDTEGSLGETAVGM